MFQYAPACIGINLTSYLQIPLCTTMYRYIRAYTAIYREISVPAQWGTCKYILVHTFDNFLYWYVMVYTSVSNVCRYRKIVEIVHTCALARRYMPGVRDSRWHHDQFAGELGVSGPTRSSIMITQSDPSGHWPTASASAGHSDRDRGRDADDGHKTHNRDYRD
jgi:hypothetical protein